MAVRAEVRYLNEEWRERTDKPRIGSKSDRLAVTAKHSVVIEDAYPRCRGGELDLDVAGFTLVNHSSTVRDFHDPEQVEKAYYAEMTELAKRTVGADEVFVTQHVVRTEDTSDFNKAYARFIHCDYSVADPRATAYQLLESRGLDTAQYESAEFAWYNTWQPIERPATKNPLTVIDAASIADGDIVDYLYTGFKADGLSSMPVRDPAHRFYYFPDMQTDELLVIKQLDTRSGHAMACPHTSFDDATADPAALPRRSVEVRLMCVFR